jgi:2-polyprenyl-3-methyl-5-hydroxy-6-metoxy-1,4-benzoquinol methylase
VSQRSTLLNLAPITARLLRFSIGTRAYRGFRDWNICYERVFEYGSTYDVLEKLKPSRVLDVAGDISLFGCFVAAHIGCTVDIVDMSDLDYCKQVRARMDPPSATRVNLIPRTRAEDLPRGMSYDAIYCISSIEHFDGDADLRFIEAVAELLNDDGLLIVTAPFTNENETVRKYRDTTYYDTHGQQQTDANFYMRFYSAAGIEQLVKQSGLELVHLTYAGEILNFCEPIFQFATAPSSTRLTLWPRFIASRLIGALSPLYPILFMRRSDSPSSFTQGKRRTTPCNPDTFLLVLRKSTA